MVSIERDFHCNNKAQNFY